MANKRLISHNEFHITTLAQLCWIISLLELSLPIHSEEVDAECEQFPDGRFRTPGLIFWKKIQNESHDSGITLIGIALRSPFTTRKCQKLTLFGFPTEKRIVCRGYVFRKNVVISRKVGIRSSTTPLTKMAFTAVISSSAQQRIIWDICTPCSTESNKLYEFDYPLALQIDLFDRAPLNNPLMYLLILLEVLISVTSTGFPAS
uniref:Uncharacterized protein n=1 Tax=Romanomermis culicivorax TaxID=13658 RepID=A0A915KLK5_ROMCU